MTWAEFKDAVIDLLPLDARRAGSATYLGQLIKVGALDLVSNIPGLIAPVETRLTFSDGERVQNALLFDLPAGARVSSVAVSREFAPDHTIPGSGLDAGYRDAARAQLEVLGWAHRHRVIGGECDVAAHNSRTGKLLTPFFSADDNMVVVARTTLKPSDWTDSDEVPFDLRDASAVASHVQAHVALSIDKNPRLAGEHMSLFRSIRRSRYVETKG